MSDTIGTILRRAISLEHPRLTLEQIGEAIREALTGQGPYAVLLAESNYHRQSRWLERCEPLKAVGQPTAT